MVFRDPLQQLEAENEILRRRLAEAEAELDEMRRTYEFDVNIPIAELREELSRVEAERDRLRERERHFAQELGIADGGQYRHDWDGPLARVLAERDAARAALAKYGQHQPPCPRWITSGDAGPSGEQHVCTCGLDVALARPAEPGTKP